MHSRHDIASVDSGNGWCQCDDPNINLIQNVPDDDACIAFHIAERPKTVTDLPLPTHPKPGADRAPPAASDGPAYSLHLFLFSLFFLSTFFLHSSLNEFP